MTKAPADIRSLARAQTALAIRTLTGVCCSKAAPAGPSSYRPNSKNLVDQSDRHYF